MAKIRYGFVTNSSSSSFIVIGNAVNFEEIDLDNGKYVAIGSWMCDGQDIIKLTPEIMDMIGLLDFDFKYIKVLQSFYDADGETITADINSAKLYSYEMDQHHSVTPSDLWHNYEAY